MPWCSCRDDGALVQQVLEDSRSAAGLRRGDLVIAAGERNVRAPADLLAVVEASSLGDPLQLKVLRGSEQMELSIEPAPLPSSQAG